MNFYEVYLILSSVCTHFNILKKRFLENIVEKGEIAQNEQFHLFSQCFLCNLYLKNPLIATFQLLSAASLNLGRPQNVCIREWVNPFPHKDAF